jgi:hypothetical protein
VGEGQADESLSGLGCALMVGVTLGAKDQIEALIAGKIAAVKISENLCPCKNPDTYPQGVKIPDTPPEGLPADR